MANEATARMKTVLEEPSEQRFIFRQGDHAVADVSGRQHAIFAAKPAGAAAIVGDGDNRGEVGDGTFAGGAAVRAAHNVLFQTTKQCGKARAATECDDAQTAGLQVFLASKPVHVRLSFRLTRAKRQFISGETILCSRPFQDIAIP